MKKIVLGITFLIVGIGFSQKKDEIILRIGQEPIKASAYKKMFNTVSKNYKHEDFRANLQLLVDYHLKLNQAKQLGIDTLRSVKNELDSYKKDLINPYLIDKHKEGQLVKEAYERSKTTISASHILVKIDAADTLKAYKKIKQAQKELSKGVAFEEVALKYSEDPSVKNNKGELGYFNVFDMVYPFENAAYQTPVGKVSKIVKTNFGYHLIKVIEKVPNIGKVEVAHLMVAGLDEVSKKKIDSIYGLLKNGALFDDLVVNLSDDSGSKNNLGKLPPFGVGNYPKAFEKVAFSMRSPGEISMPFMSNVGWHIVKFINFIPLATFEASLSALQNSVKNDMRNEIPSLIAYKKLAKEFKLKDDVKSQKIFYKEEVYNLPKDSLQKVLFKLGKQSFTQYDFQQYILNRRYKKPLEFLQEFKNIKIKDFAIDKFEETKPAYREVVKNYREGLVIFELMKLKVWDVAVNEVDQVKAYYEANKLKYQNKDFEAVKGFVQSDFQEVLNEQWMNELRKSTNVSYDENAIKALNTALTK